MMRSRHGLLLAAWFAWFWNFSYRMMVPALLPSIQASLSLSNWMAGALVGALNFGYAISAYPSGLYSSRFGPRRIIIFGTILSAVSMSLLPIPRSYWAMMVLIFAAGLGFGTYLPQGLALLSEHYERRKRGTVLGIHETGAPLGQAIGPIWVGALLSSIGWAGCIQAWAIFAMIIAASFLSIAQERGAGPKGVEIAREGRGWSLGIYATTILLNGCVRSAYMGLLSMIPIYMVQAYLADVAFVAFLVGATRFSGALGQLIGGSLSDAFGRFKVLVVVVFVTAVSTAGVVFAPYGPAMVASMVIQAMATQAFYPVMFAIISDHTPPAARAKTFGIVNAANGLIGGSLAPMAIGYLADVFDFKIAFLYPVILGLLSCFFALYLRRQFLQGTR